MPFDAARTAGLRRLEQFAPRAGRAYLERRNYDLVPGQAPAISCLSPWLRHRLLTEHEVLQAVLAEHALSEATAIVQQVLWRGYFKGWLEQRPTVWDSYSAALALERQSPAPGYDDACNGATGIACFDHWSRQLRDTGYLHNHARMWFASIWIFTLRLPWTLGAQFFLDHLVDGDPASNTLSWRWVAGLHTKGKHYLATAENIARFTQGRFCPAGQLNERAEPLAEPVQHAVRPFVPVTAEPPEHALYLMTEEDCAPPLARPHAGGLGLVSPQASGFAQAALTGAVRSLGWEAHVGNNWSAAIIAAARAQNASDVVTPYMPLGPAAEGMRRCRPRLAQAGIALHFVQRPYDQQVWPHATKGFFHLKKRIPEILAALRLDGSA
jgi:deoxyribodipyrimidine photo-lyase